MRKVRDSGVAILFVSHFLDQIYEITDRLTILRNGQFIKEVMTKDTPRDELIGMMIGKSAAELSQIGAKKARREITSGEKPIVDVKGLGKKGTINPVDVDICWAPVVPSLVDSCMVPTSRIRVPTRSTARRSTSPIRTRL